MTSEARIGDASAGERVEPVERVAKPWGHEEVLAVHEGRYVAKSLHVRRGP